jgi:hypothetical protein
MRKQPTESLFGQVEQAGPSTARGVEKIAGRVGIVLAHENLADPLTLRANKLGAKRRKIRTIASKPAAKG